MIVNVKFERSSLLKVAKKISEPCTFIVEAAYKEEIESLKENLCTLKKSFDELTERIECRDSTINRLAENIEEQQRIMETVKDVEVFKELQEALERSRESANYYRDKWRNRGSDYDRIEQKSDARERERDAALRKVKHCENRITNLEKKLHYYRNKANKLEHG